MSVTQENLRLTSSIRILVEGEPVLLDQVREGGKRVTPPLNQLWQGFPLEFHSGTADNRKLAAHTFPNLLICHQKTGTTCNNMKSGSYRYESALGPDDFLLVPERFEFDQAQSRNSNTVYTVLEISPSTLNQLFPHEMVLLNLRHFEIGKDKVLKSLFALMDMEITDGCPSGVLYAQSLSIALVEHLKQAYALSGPIKKIGNRLSEHHLQAVKSYVQENLANDISLANLADQACMSPYHFSRLFRSTMGTAPYRYVVEQRLLEARRLLKTNKTITEIATATGFSSHAHLTNSFRRRFEISPTQLRGLKK